MAPKRYLDVRYDVTDLSPDEIGQLTLEAVVQAERSDGHPSVEVEAEVVTHDDEEVVAASPSLYTLLSEPASPPDEVL